MAVNRDQILEAAAQVFRKNGFHGASMADIADAVGLQKPTLYHHFTSKQEILVELLDYALELVKEQMGTVLAQNIPVDEKLRRAMHSYLQTLSEQGDLVFVFLLEYRSLESELLARHIPNRDRFERLWRDLIQEGVEAGVFHCADISLASRVLLGQMNWTITWFRPDGRLSIEEIANQCADMFLNGIRQ